MKVINIMDFCIPAQDADYDELSNFADEIAELATYPIEAEPVRRGKWIEEPGGFMCSVCHDAWSEENEEMIKNWNYCPWCGAKMEEQE